MADTLDIELLGHFRLTFKGQVVDRPRNPRLLAYLLVTRDRVRTRHEIAFELWPESTDAQALTNLRRELHAVRRVLPDPDTFVVSERGLLGWRQDSPFRTDVDTLASAVEQARRGHLDPLREALARPSGDLLPEIYDDWIVPYREEARALLSDALDLLAAGLEARREYAEAMRALRRRITADPIHEPAYRDLMRVAALAGERAAGLQAYHSCATALRSELGVSPSPETVAAYERLQEPAHAPPITTPAVQMDPDFVGRAAESSRLLDAWDRARSGKPTIVALSGEAGIGKTRLLEEFLGWARGQGIGCAYARSYAAEGALAYSPVASWIRSDAVRARLHRLDEVRIVELARLVPDVLLDRPNLSPPAPMTESWQRLRLFEALVEAVSGSGPLVLVLDDAQWADPETLAWVHFAIRSELPSSLLLIVATRPEELDANQALVTLMLDVRGRGELEEISLGPLSDSETIRLANLVARDSLSDTTTAALLRETEGRPLLVVETVRSGLEPGELDSSGQPPDVGGLRSAWPIPPRVKAVIAGRLAQLTPSARKLAELAATFGQDFRFDELNAASDLDESALALALDELWRRRVVREHLFDSYDFSHDRIREVAISGLTPVRRQLLHRRVGQALQQLHHDDLDAVAARLAAHADAAGQRERAMDLYARAADVAGRVSASAEAVRYLERALELLLEEPATVERDRRELRLLLGLSPRLLAIEGYASLRQERTLERARVLALALKRRRDALVAANGLWGVRLVGGDTRAAFDLATASVDEAADEPDYLALGHESFGGTLLFLGDPAAAVVSFRKALETHRPGHSLPMASGTDLPLFSLAWGAHALWLLGKSAQAQSWSRRAIAGADAIGDPFMQTLAHAYAAILAQFQGDGGAIEEHSAVASGLSRRHRFVYYREWGEILVAWVMRHTADDAVRRIEGALDALRAIRGLARQPYYLSLLADAQVAANRRTAAQAALASALESAASSGETWWLPEIHRRIGELDPGPSGVAAIRTALELARQQGSRALGLRAAISLYERAPTMRADLAHELAAMRDGDEGERARAGAILEAPPDLSQPAN